MNLLHNLTCEMILFDQGDPQRIQHFLKVHSFARTIGIGENLDGLMVSLIALKPPSP